MLDLVRERQAKILGKTRKQRVTRLKFILFLSTALLVILLVGLFCAGILFAWYAKDLPRPDKVARTEGISTIIYDRNNESIYDIYKDQNRIPVAFSEMPDALKQATVAIEDKEFYKHEGFSSQGMLRASFNIIFLRKLEGGSTLTQ